MPLRVYGQPQNPRVRKVLVAAALAGLSPEVVDLKKEDFTKPEHTKRHPLGKIPVLETDQGTIHQSNAILRYFARLSSNLYGTSTYQQGQVDQWLDFANTELDVLVSALTYQVLGAASFEPEAVSKTHTDLSVLLKVLDAHLTGRTTLVGENLTVADLAVAALVNQLYTFVFDENQRKKYPNVLAWYQSVSANSAWEKEFGRTRYLKKVFPKQK